MLWNKMRDGRVVERRVEMTPQAAYEYSLISGCATQCCVETMRGLVQVYAGGNALLYDPCTGEFEGKHDLFHWRNGWTS